MFWDDCFVVVACLIILFSTDSQPAMQHLYTQEIMCQCVIIIVAYSYD